VTCSYTLSRLKDGMTEKENTQTKRLKGKKHRTQFKVRWIWMKG